MLHRPAGEAVPVAGAVWRIDHRALEHEYVERDGAGDAVAQDLLQVVAQLHAKRWMPEHVDAEIGHEVTGAGLVGVQERHGVAGARTALKPK